MTYKRKRGPKTHWQDRVRYNRAKCDERLKPCQIQNLVAANAFASYMGKRLNFFLTVKFSETSPPLSAFRQGVKRLSQWHRHRGDELRWVYVWEAVGGPHIHAMVYVSRGSKEDFEVSLKHAFSGHNYLVKPRIPGPSAMAYLCKGTDYRTHRRLRGHSRICLKMQGHIPWARCGVTQNIGKSARIKAGFETKNQQSIVKKHTCGN